MSKLSLSDLTPTGLIAAGVLAACLVTQALLPVPLDLTPAPALSPVPLPPLPEGGLPPYRAILAAPLFAQSRSLSGGSDPGAVKAANLTEFTVVGLATSTRYASAVLRAPDGRTALIQRGEKAGDLRFVGIEGQTALFSGADGLKRYPLTDPRSAQLTANAQPALNNNGEDQ